MNRGEDLRAKFKAKAAAIKDVMNSDFWKYRTQLDNFVLSQCYAMPNDEFRIATHAEYQNQGEPGLHGWLRDFIKPQFTWKSDPPVWKDEPDWCYIDGRPMQFVGQLPGDEDEIYVFQGHKQVVSDKSTEAITVLVYKICVQSKNGRVIFKNNEIS